MGLDMYLTGELFIGEEYEHKGIKKEIRISRDGDKNKIIEIPTLDEAPLSSLNFKLGYWRKANAIHNWFVKNIQDGQDNCKSYYVREEKLIELLDICKNVLEKNDNNFSMENLPSQNGFFFGSIDYDEGYYDDVRYTIAILEKALKLQDKYSLDIYYNSSW